MSNKHLLNKDGLTEDEFLKNYKPGDYERPSVTVDMLIFTTVDKVSDNIKKLNEKELKILLIKRKDHPYIGKWALPGGFVDMHESLDEAAYRELKEETNIENVYMEQLATFGTPKRDPRMRVISTAYMALVPSNNLNPIAGDDADDVAWFTVSKTNIGENKSILRLENEEKNAVIEYEISEKHCKKGFSTVSTSEYRLLESSPDAIAFDHYEEIDMALERLKNKIEYTSIAFNLVREYFTIAEIQTVYETILGRKLHRMDFMRKMKNKIEQTDLLCYEKAHRPAKYYKLKDDWASVF